MKTCFNCICLAGGIFLAGLTVSVSVFADVDIGPDWFRLGPGQLNVYAEKQSRIHPDIAIQGELMDLKVNVPVIHHTLQTLKVVSDVTIKYRIDKAILPTGPLEIRHCWNTWIITRLPVSYEKLQQAHRAKFYTPDFRDGVIGSAGRLPIGGTGVYTVVCVMTELHPAYTNPPGLYGIGKIGFPGYLVDPNTPGVSDEWSYMRMWSKSEKLMKQMTILLADLSQYEIKTECRNARRTGDPLAVRVTLKDAGGGTYPVPNAEVQASLCDRDGKVLQEVILEGEWDDDPRTMTFVMPTGWYKAACPVNAERATVRTAVNMGLPDGTKTMVVTTNEFVFSQ